MAQPRPAASLTGSLLARKGAARPAMRPQVSLEWMDDAERAAIGANGEEHIEPAPDHDAEHPEVLRQIERLSQIMGKKLAAVRAANADVEQLPGRKIAFTLRLDPRRHALLRACCAAEKRSAQALLVEALDRLIDATPGLDEIAAQMADATHRVTKPAPKSSRLG
ncbi:hypothetical protein [Novosphingobium sp.]|uniref:hypothetical protein n=1 Tax=Novosphingobium sp. TaxID=1874826 RepID=UPI002FDE2F7B